MEIIKKYSILVQFTEKRTCACNQCRVKPIDQIKFRIEVEAETPFLASVKSKDLAYDWVARLMDNSRFEILSIGEV